MKVFVYFNLHKKVWSIKALEGENKGKVIAHAEVIVLKNCELKVSESGRQRVIREKKKYVHAGVVGNIVSIDSKCLLKNKKMSDANLVTYNPYKYSSFVNKQTEKPVYESNNVLMIAKKNEGAKVFIS